MKFKLFTLLLFFTFIGFSQNEIYFFKDADNSLNIENVKDKGFKVLENNISEGSKGVTYWFKIPKNTSKSHYYFQIENNLIQDVSFYQNAKEISYVKKERYSTYKFLRNNTSYVKVTTDIESYFPLELSSEENFINKEKIEFFFIGFYYGVALLIVVFNLAYFFLFKDDSFLYYALFLMSTSWALFITDGMLNLMNLPHEVINFISISTYLCVAFFSSKFSNSFLELDVYFPKIKKYTYVIGVLAVISGVLFFIFNEHSVLLILKVLVFLLLFIYWFTGVLLFNKNIYNKIFVISYILLLFAAIDFFVLKNLGASIIKLSVSTVKITGFLQMIILSYIVLYRIKVLKNEADIMTNEIVKYSNALEKLSFTKTVKEDLDKNVIKSLSVREKEVFDLIVLSKSYKIIADELNISVNTVKFHVKNIYEKLEIKSRKEAIMLKTP